MYKGLKLKCVAANIWGMAWAKCANEARDNVDYAVWVKVRDKVWEKVQDGVWSKVWRLTNA